MVDVGKVEVGVLVHVVHRLCRELLSVCRAHHSHCVQVVLVQAFRMQTDALWMVLVYLVHHLREMDAVEEVVRLLEVGKDQFLVLIREA